MLSFNRSMIRFRKGFALGAVLLSSLAGAQVGAMLAKGQQALNAGQNAEALRLATAAVAKAPKEWQAHRLVGRAAVALDSPDRAEKAYALALKFVPAGARVALLKEASEVAILRRALNARKRSETLRETGDLALAAEASEEAYRLMPKRYAYGIASAELFEKAGKLEDARRMLDEVRGRTLPSKVAEDVKVRLEAVLTKIDGAREAARLEKERREAAEKQRDELLRQQLELFRRRYEAAQREKEDKERAEKEKAERERQIKQETERLQGLLSDYRTQLSNAESDLRRAQDRVSDAEREVREADGQADRARSRRNDAKREVEDWKDKIDSAKTDVAKEVYRSGLRSAEAKYDDAKNDYERANGRYEAAKSRLSDAERGVNDAKTRLDQAQRDVRETEDAINRLASGG